MPSTSETHGCRLPQQPVRIRSSLRHIRWQSVRGALRVLITHIHIYRNSRSPWILQRSRYDTLTSGTRIRRDGSQGKSHKSLCTAVHGPERHNVIRRNKIDLCTSWGE